MRPIRLLLAAILFLGFQSNLHSETRQQRHAPLKVNLLKLASGPCMSQGRLQDPEFNRSKERLQEMNRIMHHGTDAVLALADSLANSRPTPSMLCGWKGMALGDVALITLFDLFREPGGRFTVPELDWDNFLESSSPKPSAEQVLREFVRKRGRHGLRGKWDAFWNEHKNELIWDERDRCYRPRPGHPD